MPFPAMQAGKLTMSASIRDILIHHTASWWSTSVKAYIRSMLNVAAVYADREGRPTEESCWPEENIMNKEVLQHHLST